MTIPNGKWMGQILVWAVILLAPALAWAADAPPCRLTQYSSLPMKTETDGRVSVPITIQDKTYSFLVDTGGARATIGWDQAEELGIEKKAAGTALIGVGGRYLSSIIIPKQITLGGMTGKDLAVWVEPRSGTSFDGTLAPDMLTHFDVELDFARGKMNLFSQDHCPGKVVYWTQSGFVTIPMEIDNNGHIRIPVTLDGKQITAIVDTGAVTSLASIYALSFLGISEDAPDMKLKSSGGYRKRTRIYSYPFKTLEMGGVTVKNPRITIGSNQFAGSLRADMLLGVGILRQLHVYIAYGEKKMYITPAQAN